MTPARSDPARDAPQRARLDEILAAFGGVRLLVVGDAVLDEYLWGDVERVSPEAPVPVVQVRDESVVLGGAANVLRNVVALGAGGDLCTSVGDDPDGRLLVDLLKDLGVDASGVVPVEGRPTTRKSRVVARGQQVVRFDRESIDPLPDAAARQLEDALGRALPGVHGVVVQDYGKGLLAPGLARRIVSRAVAAGLPVAVDPKGELGAYRGAALLKPNRREAEALSGVRVRGAEDLARAAAALRRAIGGGDVVVTGGRDGMTLFGDEEDGRVVPTASRDVFDVQGAGDTVLAVLALARRVGASLLEAAILANAAARVVVGKVGTATASPDEVRGAIPAALSAAGGSP